MLKVLQSLTLFSVANAGTLHHVATPEFSLLREDPESPVVAVNFPNGHSDVMILTPLDEGDGVPIPQCSFVGHLAKEPEHCVAITGCLGSEDVELSFMSRHAPGSGMYMWKKDGTVQTSAY